jgi:hypothetical protein
MPATPAPSDAVLGRDQLLRLRRDLVARLSRGPLDGGDLTLAAGLAAALALVKTEAPPADPGSRVVLADDGKRLALTVYGPSGPLAATELSFLRALSLAADLVAAVRRRVEAIEPLR